jgi:dipeptidase E
MKKMLLTSDGISNVKLKKEFLRMLPKDVSKIKVLMIITAGKHCKNTVKYTKESIRELTDVGIDIKSVELLDIDNKKILSVKRRFDVLYVCGGNTFFLLKKIRQSRFNVAIKNFVKSGKIYIGVSAGSYIACPTIDMATWKHLDTNMVGLKDLTALGLVPFIAVAHFAKKYEDVIRKGASSSKYKVMILKDGQGVSVIGNKFKLVGIGKGVKAV